MDGPPNRPDHPDFWKMSDIVLRHDGPTTDPTTMHQFSLEDRMAQEIDPGVLTYVSYQRAGVYLQQLGLDRDLVIMTMVGAAWIDAFLVGVEWQKAKVAAAQETEAP